MNDLEKIEQQLYNLILIPGTREWERRLLIEAKNKFASQKQTETAISDLLYELRPLALRDNLTPDVAEFYQQLTNTKEGQKTGKVDKHEITDLDHQEIAVFAGGCFWCMVEPFEERAGVLSVLSGYTGTTGTTGTVAPTYDQVISGTSGYVEAVEIIFDTRKITYDQLVTLFWQISDPTDAFGQFQDRGSHYRPIIFVQNATQRQTAEASKRKLIESAVYLKPIVVTIEEARTFWPAENYHQQFYKKYPKRYKKIKKARQQLQRYQSIEQKLKRMRKRA